VKPTDVALVQSSFRQIVPIAEQAAALFYARLFELDPASRSFFQGDMREQGRRLMTMLGIAVGSLDRLEALLPVVRSLGARHGSYGVAEEHYATVGAALMWTLEKALGPEFTPAVAEAWTTTYTLLANTMLDGQHRARSAA
jgi:hemoglobin-like flavoprotein